MLEIPQLSKEPLELFVKRVSSRASWHRPGHNGKKAKRVDDYGSQGDCQYYGQQDFQQFNHGFYLLPPAQ